MPIEFRCIQCQKLLRVSDEAVGKKARCPDCGTIQEARNDAGIPNAPLTPEVVLSPTPTGSASASSNNPFGDYRQASSPFGQPQGTNPYTAPHTASQQSMSFEMVRAKVQAPAVCLLIAGGILTLIMLVTGALYFVGAMAGKRPMFDVLSNAVGLIIGFCAAMLMTIGARRMQQLESYGFAITASIVAILPCTPGCCLLTMPIGIWSLIVLMDPQVRAAFRS